VKDDHPKVTGAQFRAARAILNLSAQELAKETRLSRGTIQRAELESANVTASNTARIVEALEKLGVIFIPTDGEGPGVRLRKSRKK
jgi:transcriptional regulator with XRE-family HTH domain